MAILPLSTAAQADVTTQTTVALAITAVTARIATLVAANAGDSVYADQLMELAYLRNFGGYMKV